MQDETPLVPETLPPAPRPRKWRRRLVRFALIVLLILILAPFVFRSVRIGSIPDPEEPDGLEALRSLELPDEDNAFVELHLAAERLEYFDGDLFNDFDPVWNHGWNAATPEQIAWLEANRETFMLWSRAAAKRDGILIFPSEYLITSDLSISNHCREINVLARLHAEELHATRGPDHAWPVYRTMIENSRHFATHSAIIDRIIGIALVFHMTEGLVGWSIDPRLSKPQLLAVRQEIEAILERTPPPSEGFAVEYLIATNSITEALKPDGKVQFEDLDFFPRWPYPRPILWMLGEPDASIRLLKCWHRHQARYVDLPAYLRPEFDEYHFLYDDGADLRELNKALTPERFRNALNHSLAGGFVPALNESLKAYDRERVYMSCLRVALAAQAFHREHQRYPTELDELVPEYLPESPIDWYSGDPLLYRLDADGAIVYSVYVDQFDDGGEEIGYTTEVLEEERDPVDFGIRIRTPGWRPLYAPRPGDFAVE